MKTKISIIIFMLCFAVVAYNYFHKSKKNTSLECEIFNISPTLKTYNPYNIKFDSTTYFLAEYKIYTYINVSCASCIASIEQWGQIKEKLDAFDVNIVMICGSGRSCEIFKYMCENNKVKNMGLPYFIDSHNFYIEGLLKNNQENSIYTILTNYENKVIEMGDPTKSEIIFNNYLNAVQVSE